MDRAVPTVCGKMTQGMGKTSMRLVDILCHSRTVLEVFIFCIVCVVPCSGWFIVTRSRAIAAWRRSLSRKVRSKVATQTYHLSFNHFPVTSHLRIQPQSRLASRPSDQQHHRRRQWPAARRTSPAAPRRRSRLKQRTRRSSQHGTETREHPHAAARDHGHEDAAVHALLLRRARRYPWRGRCTDGERELLCALGSVF